MTEDLQLRVTPPGFSPVDLRYPIVQLHPVIEPWPFSQETAQMLSTKDDSSVEDTASSIGDSTWDLIDDGSIGTSDDECHRLSRQRTPMSEGSGEGPNALDTSRAQPTLDPSVEDENFLQDHHFREDNQTLQDLYASTNLATLRRPNQEQKAHRKRNLYSTAPPYQYNPPSDKVILLEESVTDDAASNEPKACTTAFATLESFGGPKFKHLSSALPFGSDCNMIGTVRQHMANELYQPDRPYRILYVGPDTVENAIIQKIASALISQLGPHRNLSRSSKSTFSVIPVSAFGSQGSPEVVLVSSSGLQISVDRCTSARLGKYQDTEALYIGLDNDETVCSIGNGPFTMTSSSCTLPDLGIIFVDERDISSTKLVQSYAQSFMNRHQVPFILISSQQSWTKSAFYDDVNICLPHLCIEACPSLGDKSQVLARLPIDLASFIKLDAVQMSRSLAYVHLLKNGGVVGVQKDSESTDNKKTHFQKVTTKSKAQELCTLVERSLHMRPKLLFLIGAFLCSALTYIALIQSASQVGKVPVAQNVKHTGKAQASTLTSTSAVAGAQVSFTSSATASIHIQGMSPTHSSDLSPTVTQSDVTNINGSERFMVSVSENYHIVLQPPPWFNALRKPPALSLSISRGNESVHFAHTPSANGTYTLRLEQNNYHGMINVTVWTTRKPLLKESMIIEFGNTWLNMFNGRMNKKLITRNAGESLGMNVFRFQNLLALTRLRARSLVQQANTTQTLLRSDIKTKALSLTSKTGRFVLRCWMDGVDELSNGFRGHHIPMRLNITTQKGRVANPFSTLVHSASSLSIDWVQSYVQKLKRLSILHVAGNVRQYRETHLIESQTLAVRIWWSVRGGPPSRSGAARPSIPGRKYTTATLS